MSTTPQAFYLRLNNYQGFMTGALADLYSSESMVDVTLTAEGQMIRAHRVVLSACSPYFKNIFLDFDNRAHYPIIIIKDIPFADLKAIVEFIYKGEITVPREQLESILTNGAVLQIKGLSDVNRKKSIEDYDNESFVHKDLDEMTANTCESSETKQNKARKRTRKRVSKVKTTINGYSSNGDNCANYGDISSLEDTNDGIPINGFEIQENINFIKENAKHSKTGNDMNKNKNITSLVKYSNNKEKQIVGDRDSILAVNLVEQSMRVDVEEDVHLDSNHGLRTDVIIEATISTNVSNNSQNNQCDDQDLAQKPIEGVIENMEQTFDSSVDVKQSCDSSSSKSKSGIPKKGISIRSQKKYKCPVCQKVYVSPQNMKEHLRNTHTNPDEKYICSVCTKEYSWKHALDRHFKSKHSDRIN